MALSLVSFLSLVLGLAAMRPEKGEVPGKGAKTKSKPTLIVQESSRIITSRGLPAPRISSSSVSAKGLQLAHLAASTLVYHLTDDGAKDCDYGVTLTETDCLAKANLLVARNGVKRDRSYLVSGSHTNAPPGCSIQTKNDWAVHYNTNMEGENDDSFALVCHGNEYNVHGVSEGENECDFGAGVKVDKCLVAVNRVLDQIAGNVGGPGSVPTSAETVVNVVWDERLPPGCSLHVGQGTHSPATAGMLAWFNTKTDAQNDGSYVMVCTGTPVPVSR